MDYWQNCCLYYRDSAFYSHIPTLVFTVTTLLRYQIVYYQHNKEAPKTVTDKDNLIEVSKTAGQVKRKENQTTRPKSTVTRNIPNAKRKRGVVQSMDDAVFQELRAKMAKNK